jgi:Cu(I)/Ag(I) efflux system protein CusF
MKLAVIAAIGALIAGPSLAQAPTPGMSPRSAMPQTVEGTGVVEGVNAKAGTITLHHGPIATLKWPAMTMTFKASPEVLNTAKTGQKVKFTLKPDGNEIVAVQPN